jgi:hypothetical protein
MERLEAINNTKYRKRWRDQQYKVQETMERLEAPVKNHISIKIARDYFRPFPQRLKG